jgi:hypothetical protein
MRPYLKKTLHKNKAGGVAQGEGPEFKPQYQKKKKANPTILVTKENRGSGQVNFLKLNFKKSRTQCAV